MSLKQVADIGECHMAMGGQRKRDFNQQGFNLARGKAGLGTFENLDFESLSVSLHQRDKVDARRLKEGIRGGDLHIDGAPAAGGISQTPEKGIVRLASNESSPWVSEIALRWAVDTLVDAVFLFSSSKTAGDGSKA